MELCYSFDNLDSSDRIRGAIVLFVQLKCYGASLKKPVEKNDEYKMGRCAFLNSANSAVATIGLSIPNKSHRKLTMEKQNVQFGLTKPTQPLQILKINRNTHTLCPPKF